MVFQETISINTQGRSIIDISARVFDCVNRAGINLGLCNIFIQHTSASLILCENADPDVRDDLETFMTKLVVDGDPMFRHIAEGSDDMPAHIRSILTDSSLTIPVSGGTCALGTWQGVYLWEHRHQGHTRNVVATIYGE